MVGMAAVQGVSDDNARLEPPDHQRYACSCLRGIDDSAIGEAQVLSGGDSHHLRRARSLLCTDFTASSGAQLAGRQVEYSSASSEHLRSDQGAAANELDVVRMRP